MFHIPKTISAISPPLASQAHDEHQGQRASEPHSHQRRCSCKVPQRAQTRRAERQNSVRSRETSRPSRSDGSPLWKARRRQLTWEWFSCWKGSFTYANELYHTPCLISNSGDGKSEGSTAGFSRLIEHDKLATLWYTLVNLLMVEYFPKFSFVLQEIMCQHAKTS